MIAHDRRRVVVASLFTLAALPALWVFNRESAATSGSPTIGAAGVDVNAGADTAPTTTAYEPEPPLFVGGDEQPVPPVFVNIAVPTTAGANQVTAKAGYHRYGIGSRLCTTLLAPDGALLTVTNVDNGQSTTCTNTLGMTMPTGADIVLHTEVFAEIGDLADAPLPVRVSW
ncbi:MAG: hypothetical protein WCC60_19610 [Ilumatobacteraceae bacterium]